MSQLAQVTAMLPLELIEKLKLIAGRRGLDANTVLQQAISTEALFDENVGIKDKVLIKRSDGTVSEVVFSNQE